jgi:hypothetical protein
VEVLAPVLASPRGQGTKMVARSTAARKNAGPQKEDRPRLGTQIREGAIWVPPQTFSDKAPSLTAVTDHLEARYADVASFLALLVLFVLWLLLIFCFLILIRLGFERACDGHFVAQMF